MAKIIGNTTATPMPVADWNQNNSKKADYIKNRTHYVDYATELIVADTTETEAISIVNNSLFDDNFSYLITVDGVKYVCAVYNNRDGEICLGDSRIYIVDEYYVPDLSNPIDVPFNIVSWLDGDLWSEHAVVDVYYPDTNTHTIKIEKITGEEVHQLDEKFIPNSIARVSDIGDVVASDINSQISEHNTSENAHGDIRGLIAALSGLVGDKSVSEQISETLNSVLPKITTITLRADQWVGATSPWSQVVSINGTTANSKVDLLPTAEQVEEMQDNDIAFMAENNDGVVTMYAIYGKPEVDYEMQVLITEVQVI